MPPSTSSLVRVSGHGAVLENDVHDTVVFDVVIVGRRKPASRKAGSRVIWWVRALTAAGRMGRPSRASPLGRA